MRPRVRAAVALILALASPALAIDIATLKPQGYVSDFASVVDSQSKAELEAFGARVEKATGTQMAFVTLDTLEGEALEDFANDLYRRWGIGQKGKDEGLLLLLIVRERRSRLEVGRGLEEFIPDGMAGSLLRDMRPFLQRNQYGEAFKTAAHSLTNRIAQAKGIQIPEQTPLRRRPPPQPSGGDIPWPIILGGIILLFWVLGSGGRRRGGGGGGGGFLPGLILGNMMGSRPTYGGYGGGGFGGYDSGGGFGGFGGGDSGGGGASGSW